jgi:hypothetical protein
MLAASNKVMREHGLVVAEDQQIADLEAHLHRARSEATTASAYANYFGAALKQMGKRTDVSGALQSKIREALEWTPEKGEKVISAIGTLPPGEVERATH